MVEKPQAHWWGHTERQDRDFFPFLRPLAGNVGQQHHHGGVFPPAPTTKAPWQGAGGVMKKFPPSPPNFLLFPLLAERAFSPDVSTLRSGQWDLKAPETSCSKVRAPTVAWEAAEQNPKQSTCSLLKTEVCEHRDKRIGVLANQVTPNSSHYIFIGRRIPSNLSILRNGDF